MFRYGAGGFHHPVLAVFFLAFLAALVVLAVIAVVRMWRHPHAYPAAFPRGAPAGAPMDPALAELRLRYARGDITWEEFEQRASRLGYPFPGPTGPAPSPGPTGSPPAP
jgi:uncharacterized membrane protein